MNKIKNFIDEEVRPGDHLLINDRSEPLEVVDRDPVGVTELTLEGHNTEYTIENGKESPVSNISVGPARLKSFGGGVDEEIDSIEIVEPEEDGGDDDGE